MTVNMTELIKMAFTSLIVSSTLQALGAEFWVIMVCAIGLGIFWIGPKQKVEEQK